MQTGAGRAVSGTNCNEEAGGWAGAETRGRVPGSRGPASPPAAAPLTPALCSAGDIALHGAGLQRREII